MKISDFRISESTRERYDNPPHIREESVLVYGDAQIPFHDAEWINKVRHLALTWKIKRQLWAGDMLNFDAFSFYLVKKKDINQELDEGEKYLNELINGFEKTDWLMGNHEARLRRSLNEWLSSERIAKLMGVSGKVQLSEYFWCWIGDDWQVEHPNATSEIPGRAATWLAEKYNRNTAMFHNHETAWTQTRDDRIAIDVGMCMDEARCEYVSLRHNKKPHMTNGALILRWDGKQYWAHHLTRYTDFTALERIRW